MHIRHVFPGLLLGSGDKQGQLVRRVNEVGEEAEDMDGQEPIIFCGVERLPSDVEVAVAVALDVFVNLILNDRPEHGAILHIRVDLQRFLD